MSFRCSLVDFTLRPSVLFTRYDARCMLDGIDGGQVEGDVILTRFPWVL